MKNKNLMYLGVAVAAYLLFFNRNAIAGLKIPYSKLSAYTIAKNCTDITDCQYGIEELKNFIKFNYPNNTRLAYNRLNALYKKLEYLNKNNGN